MSLALRPETADGGEAVTPAVLEALHCLRVAVTVFDGAERLIFANQHFNYMFRSLPHRDALVGLECIELLRLEIAGGEVQGAEIDIDLEGFIRRCHDQLFAGDYAPRDLPLADGRIIEVKTRRTPVGGWVALWTDVTAARQNLSRLNQAIALSADAFAFFDRADRLTLCNDEYAALAGAPSAADIVGLSFPQILDRIAAHSIAAGEREAWHAKRLEIHRQPAGAMTVETSGGTAYLLRDRAGEGGGRIVVFTDVTEHRRAEKSLAEQSRTLADTRRALAVSKAHSDAQANYLADLAVKLDQAAASADTTKTTLLRTMSHELKTPLNAIIGFSDLLSSLADCATPDQVREYAGLIHTGGNNLLRMLNQILDLTKISAGRYELRRQPMNVGRSLWEAAQRQDERAYTKNIAILTGECDEHLAVDADETALTAMLTQLIENAVNFTQSGGKVVLSALRHEAVVHIAVADNGPGVPQADLARILEPFEQGGRSTTDHEAGAGLGLTLVRAFAELHGGRLTLHSAPGEGFTAILDLPAAR
jgi:two-component system, cell cycle sensor histidine kinase PleC